MTWKQKLEYIYNFAKNTNEFLINVDTQLDCYERQIQISFNEVDNITMDVLYWYSFTKYLNPFANLIDFEIEYKKNCNEITLIYTYQYNSLIPFN